MRGKMFTSELECECGGIITLQYEFFPGVYTGPWENSYPDEYGDERITPCDKCGRKPTDEEAKDMFDSATEYDDSDDRDDYDYDPDWSNP